MQRFFEEGDKVKMTLRFRGREMAHQELGTALLNRVKDDTSKIAKVEWSRVRRPPDGDGAGAALNARKLGKQRIFNAARPIGSRRWRYGAARIRRAGMEIDYAHPGRDDPRTAARNIPRRGRPLRRTALQEIHAARDFGAPASRRSSRRSSTK